jgi:parallel beta-helix repeat protein
MDVLYTGSYGIHVDSSPGPVSIVTNKVSFAASNGIRILDSAGVLVKGNTSHDNDFNGIALQSSSGNRIVGNVSYANAKPSERAAVGIDVNEGSSNNLLRANTTYDNQDSGIQVYNGSNGNLVIRNVSYGNGDHGFDTVQASGNRFFSNTSYGNFKDGYSVEGNATNTALANNIAMDNGLTTDEFDIYVDSTSGGFSSDYDLAWNSTAQTVVKYAGLRYATIQAFAAATGQESHGIGADPKFVAAENGNLRLSSTSPAIDSANAAASRLALVDHDGVLPTDTPGTPNTGAGTPPYMDRGAYEYSGPGRRKSGP